LLQSLWELFHQKLSLNFTTARCCPVLLHKIKMLDPIGFAVEFSRIRATRPSVHVKEVTDAVSAAEKG
jgi:hypothetical protein